MKTKTRALVALAGSAVVALMASPAFAQFSDCESDPRGCGSSGPSGPPPMPNLPRTVNTEGDYFVALGTIQDQHYQEGYYRNGQTTYFGGGAFHPIGGDGVTLKVGTPDNNITLLPTLSPLGAVRVTAVAQTPQDPRFPDFDIVARGSLSLGYLVDLHASNTAAADALAALLGINGAIAHIAGDYAFTTEGTGWGSVSASTGTGELASGLQQSFGLACSPIGYSGTPGACGAGSYSLGLNFVNGAAYADGDPLDFYSYVGLSASANAGPPDLGYYPGSFEAYIDPAIIFSSALDLSQYSLRVGGVDSPLIGGGPSVGGVPEPATWAMMLVGFGALGSALRRRRSLAAGLAA